MARGAAHIRLRRRAHFNHPDKRDGLDRGKILGRWRTSSSGTAFAIGHARVVFSGAALEIIHLPDDVLGGSPAISADSGCPCPDMRWHEPHAISATPGSPFTMRGAGPCSSGNQSEGWSCLLYSRHRILLRCRAREPGPSLQRSEAALIRDVIRHAGRPWEPTGTAQSR